MENETSDKPKLFNIKLGWKPSSADPRDYKFSLPSSPRGDLPTKVDLKHKIRQIFKQDYNDCVANGSSNLISSLDYNTKYLRYTPSRLYVYYNARQIDGNQYFDEGTSIRNAMKCLAKDSFISEESYKYIQDHVFMRPPMPVYEEARSNKVYIKCYKNIDNNLINLKYVLSQGNIIIFGALLFESFVNLDKNFKCPDPNPSIEKTLGGHCMLIVGYNNDTECFTIANSWGTQWGNEGFHFMSYKYITDRDLSNDFWVCEQLTKDL